MKMHHCIIIYILKLNLVGKMVVLQMAEEKVEQMATLTMVEEVVVVDLVVEEVT